jgi:hypothetical protein
MKRIATAVLAASALLALSGCASDHGYRDSYTYNPYVDDDGYYRDRDYYLRQRPGYYDQYGGFRPYY